MGHYEKINALYQTRPEGKVPVMLAIAKNQEHSQALQALVNDDKSFEAYVFQIELEGREYAIELLSAGALARQQDITYQVNYDLVEKVLGVSAAHGISTLPAELQEQFFESVATALGNQGENALQLALKPYLGDIVELKSFSKKIGVVLVFAILSYEAAVNMKKWWKGEISGVRCAKNVVDSLGSCAGGLALASGGAYVGAVAGPVGVVCGALVGGLLGSVAAATLTDWATQCLFNVPKDVALENAYNYLEVSQTASNDEINKSYKRLCLVYHPDKGGSDEAFHKLQMCLQVVRLQRT